MPTVRYEIRNEFGLSDPELYRAGDENDPEALLEGVAMAGLVGVLRQLGDLAEFAAEIFHDLHEEVTATAARGHGLMLRVQQLEAEFPSVEKAFLSQTNPCPMSYNEGIDWHANLRVDQNLVTQGDMPRFILDSYEECRGPPRLFMLDKFDVAGAGACSKRYSDPSCFKVALASSGMMEEEAREKKTRKIKKKGSRWRNGVRSESFLAPLIRSNLQSELSEQISAKVPMRHVRLKSRNLIGSNISHRSSFMEHLLQVSCSEQNVISENSSSDFPVMVTSIDQVGLVPEVHETVTDTPVEYPMVKERNGGHSPAKNDSAYFPIYELGNQETKGLTTFEQPPDEKTVIETEAKRAFTFYDNSDEPEKHSPAILEVDPRSFIETQITTAHGCDGHKSADKNVTKAILDGYSSAGAEMGPSGLPELDQRNSFSNIVVASQGGFDGYRSDDIGSDLENYMDALNSMESENETDSESKQKSGPGTLKMEAYRMDGIYKRQQELPQFSQPGAVGKPTEKASDNILKNEVSALSRSEKSGSLTDTQPPQEGAYNFNVSVTPEIYLGETHGKTPEEMHAVSMIQESISPVHLLTSETCNTNGSESTNAKAATVGVYASSCVTESTSNGEHVCLHASATDTLSGYAEGSRQVCQQLTSNVGELSKYAGNSETFSDKLLYASDLECSSLGEEEIRENDEFMKHADNVPSVDPDSSEGFLDSVDAKEVLKSADKSNINELLLLPDSGSSVSVTKVPIEGTHPADCPEEQISEISDRGSMLDHLSLTQDCSNLDEAPRHDGTTLFNIEMILHMDGEKQQPIEQESEALSGENTLVNPSLSTNISSAIIKSDDLPAEMEGNEKPENLAVDLFSNNLRLSQGYDDNLDGNVPCIMHTSELLSKAHDGMESLDYAANSTISFDILSVSDVPERADADDLFSEDKGSASGDSTRKEVPTWCVKESTPLFTEEDTETCSGKGVPATNCDISIENSPIVANLCESAAKIDDIVAPFEDSIDYDIGGKVQMPNLLSSESEQFSAAEEPQNSHKMDSNEILPRASANEAFHDGRDLSSTEPVCAVIGPINLVTDNLEFPCGPTTSSLPKGEQIKKRAECDNSLDEYVILEADDDNQGANSIYSPKVTAFDLKLQEDYLPGAAGVDWKILETDETSHPKNITLTPDDQPTSSTDLGSVLPIEYSSYAFNAKLLDGACQTIVSESNFGNKSSLFSSGTEDAVSREGMGSSSCFIVEPAIPLVYDNEPHVTSSHQERNQLQASDIMFERAFSDEQSFSHSNSEDIDGQPLKLEPFATPTTAGMNELDIPSSDTGLYKQREAEAIPSECTSQISVGSMVSHISPPVVPVIASSSSALSETSPQEFLEPQVGEENSSLGLQLVEGTPPLPPLPPIEWRTGKHRFGSLVPVGDTAQPSKSTNPFVAVLPLDGEHPLGSVTAGVEMVQPVPFREDELVLQGSLNSEEAGSDLPSIADEARHRHGMNPPNPSLLLSHPENGRNSDSHDAFAVEDMMTKHQQLLQGVQRIDERRPLLSQLLPSLEFERSQLEAISMVDLEPQMLQGVESTEDKRPQLGQLLPTSELERSQHESIHIEDTVPPLNPFWTAPLCSEEWNHQYGYGLYGGESLQHLNLSAPLPVTVPNMPPYGFLYPMGENPSMIYDFMMPATEGERPNWKHRSIRDRPRNPLIEAFAAHDKSKLRKVSELDLPQNRPMVDERDSLLEQIRNKSFNLKPANAPRPNMKGPSTNLKLTAILEKANAIRKALVGSDEEEDAESWIDS